MKKRDTPLSWKEILVTIGDMGEIVTVTGVAETLEYGAGPMATVFLRFRVWGYLKYADQVKKGFGGYVLTGQGKQRIHEIKTGTEYKRK